MLCRGRDNVLSELSQLWASEPELQIVASIAQKGREIDTPNVDRDLIGSLIFDIIPNLRVLIVQSLLVSTTLAWLPQALESVDQWNDIEEASSFDMRW